MPKTKPTTKPKTTPKTASPSRKPTPGGRKSPLKTTTVRGKKVVLLSGGNPQIAKGDGDAPVQAYIAALGDWKHDLVKRVDALIVEAVPGVQKAVKWNSPFYGVAGQGWFASLHVFTRYLKVTFFYGRELSPMPPGPSKDKHARYLDLHEDDELDDKQLRAWMKQAAAIPGWLG